MYFWLFETNLMITKQHLDHRSPFSTENGGWIYTLIFRFPICYTQKFNENNHTNFRLQCPGQSSVIRDLPGGDALGMMGLPCGCNTAGGVKGPEGRPWSCPGFEQTSGQSPLAKLSTGQQLSWQFWVLLPEETDLTKSFKNTDVIATKAWGGCVFDEGRRTEHWEKPTLHPSLWGTNQAHLSGGWDMDSGRHTDPADTLQQLILYSFPPSPFPKQFFEGRSWEQLKLAVRPSPPTHPLPPNLAITTQLGYFKYSEYLGVVFYFQETPVLVINKQPVMERSAFIQPESLSLVQYST